MPYGQPCRNPDATHSKGWQAPDLMRVYYRPTLPVDPQKRYGPTKRQWVAIGWICPECRQVTLDPEPEEAA